MPAEISSSRRTRTRRGPIGVVALLVVAALISSCGGGGSSSAGGGGGSGDAASRDPLTKEARQWGLGPQPDSKVKLQPDVVIVSGAGNAIRSVSDGGLTWTIDGKATGADKLEPGKIMFVTSRAVGRVLAISDDGGDRKVTIGPVTLTDIIRDGTFEKDLKLDEPIKVPGVEPDFETQANTLAAAHSGGKGSAVWLAAAKPQDSPAQLTAAAGAGSGACCADGIKGTFSVSKGGDKFYGTVGLNFTTPDAKFYLDISGGKLQRAELTITGGFGISVDFEAGIDNGTRVLKVAVPVGGAFEFPIAQILGIPVTFQVSQGMTLKSAFAANIGTIKGHGAFSLGSSLGFGYSHGSFAPRNSVSFKRELSLMDSLSGVPVGVMGLLLQHNVKFDVGLNAGVFRAGVYVKLDTRYGVTRGSGLGAALAECQGVAIGVFARAGVGYSISGPVADVVNGFLSLLNIKPIARKAGVESSVFPLVNESDVRPSVELCGVPGDAGGKGASGGAGGGGGGQSAKQ